MAGFEKIELDSPETNRPTAPETMSRKRNRNHFFASRNGKITIGVIAFLVLFLVFGIILPAKNALSSFKKVQKDQQALTYAFKTQNVDLASEQLGITKGDLTKAQGDLHRMFYLKIVPIAAFYYNDADHLVNAGFAGISAATTVVDALKPYSDVLGLKGQHSFSGGSAEQRIQTAVLTMGKVTPKIDEISTSLRSAQTEMDKVKPEHYPAILGGRKIQQNLTTARTVLDNSVAFINQATPLIKVLPQLLGEPDAKKYLVLFQNDKELRPTGGFITADAIFQVEHGVIKSQPTTDIYKIDDSVSHPKAPEPILKYLPKVNELNLRDSNLSPDFPKSMETFNELYKTSSDYKPVDGIIGIDTHVLLSTLKILGPVTVDGITFTTENDPECDCANAIYQLENNISRPVNYVKENRKALLSDLLYTIMQKAFASSPKKYWGPLFQTMLAEVSQKHVLFDIYDKNAQTGLMALNAAGAIQNFDGDYLHINEANFGGQKSNLYVKEDVTQDYKVDGDGSVTKTITLHYKNDHAPSNCNLEAGGLCLNATLRDWVRVYVPKGSQLVDNLGSEVKVTSSDELGKTVFEGFITVRPLGAKTYTLSYKLPFKITGKSLPLYIQKQPGTDANQYTITKGTQQLNQFNLLTDQTLKLSL